MTHAIEVPRPADSEFQRCVSLNRPRLLRLMRMAIERCRLDLHGMTVLTEAATGPYVVTPVLAAMAGAERVYAVTRDTRYGSIEQVTAGTLALAAAAGRGGAIEISPALTPEIIGEADIVTNSGHVRPIDAAFVACLKPRAVISLMYEAWEFRPADLDLAACRARGIRVAGTNERIPEVDVFSYLGIMAVKLLLDAGVAVYGSDILVLCDNPFAPFIARGLTAAGARIEVAESVADAARTRAGYDAVLIALRPRDGLNADESDVQLIASRWAGAVVAQYWGDVDRAAMHAAGIPVWPRTEPKAGHMGALPSCVGPEPIVRLQCGGLKVGEVLAREAREGTRCNWHFIDEV